MTERPGCAETREVIPELATGVAAPGDRARALRHLAGCGRCHRELESRTAIVDELLLLTREREPPAGFEAAVMAPLSRERRERASRRRRRLRAALVTALSMVLTGVLAGGAVWRQTAEDRRLATDYRSTLDVAGGRYLRAAPVLASTTTVGYAFAYEGSPSWLFVTMTAAQEPGRYHMKLTTRDGGQVTLGTMDVRNGQGSWGGIIPVSVRDVLIMHFRDPAGRDLAARLG